MSPLLLCKTTMEFTQSVGSVTLVMMSNLSIRASSCLTLSGAPLVSYAVGVRLIYRPDVA